MFPAKSVIFPWVSYVTVKKMKLDEVELRSPSFDRFPFLLCVHFYSFTAAGIWDEIKVNELPDWDWAWSDRTKAANWGSRKGSLRVFVFVCFFLPSYIPHLSMHLEKSRRLSVLWTILNFSMISAEKVPRSFIFVIAVEWISPVKHRVQKRWPK